MLSDRGLVSLSATEVRLLRAESGDSSNPSTTWNHKHWLTMVRRDHRDCHDWTDEGHTLFSKRFSMVEYNIALYSLVDGRSADGNDGWMRWNMVFMVGWWMVILCCPWCQPMKSTRYWCTFDASPAGKRIWRCGTIHNYHKLAVIFPMGWSIRHHPSE